MKPTCHAPLFALVLALVLAAAVPLSCVSDFDNALRNPQSEAIRLSDIQQIISNNDLTEEEKRDSLTALLDIANQNLPHDVREDLVQDLVEFFLSQ